jgi:hypothetical protein
MSTLIFVLLAVALVVGVLLAVAARRRRGARLRHAQAARQSGEDDSPTGYVQGVWLLGGADSAAPLRRHLPDDARGDGSHDGDSADGGSR